LRLVDLLSRDLLSFHSRSARFEENDYGFSRTKNLNTEKQGERKNLQESKSVKSFKNGKLLQSDKNFENQRNEVLNDEKEDDNGEAGKMLTIWIISIATG
jgi:hypothetical protein